jgi:hypothetical protein
MVFVVLGPRIIAKGLPRGHYCRPRMPYHLKSRSRNLPLLLMSRGNLAGSINRFIRHSAISTARIGSMWPCGPLRFPRCSLRSSWSLSRSPLCPPVLVVSLCPPVPLVSSPACPLCPPVLVVSLCPPVPLVSSPACPPVPLVYHSNSLVWPAAAAPFPGVLLPTVRWFSSLAVAHACIHT